MILQTIFLEKYIMKPVSFNELSLINGGIHQNGYNNDEKKAPGFLI